MNKYLRWGIRLIGPALLLLFIWRSDWSRLLASFSSINIWPVLLSLALMPVFIAVKAWRWNLLMRELGMQAPPLGYSMALYTIGLYLGGLTPGQSGDFIKAWYLKERGQPLAPALFSIVLDRLFDFLIMALLALLALVEFLDLLPRSAQIATIAFAAIVFTLTPLLMARGPREWIITRALPLLPTRVREAIARWRDQLGALSLRPALLAKLVVASVASAASTIARIYVLFLALSLSIPLLAIVSSTALIAILQALPISFAGIGVRDAILVLVLDRYGSTTEQALTLSALYLLINIEHIIIGFLVSLRYPLGSPPPADALSQTEPEMTR
ncbi:MAG TPA: lysylphosphatidylglycerol synthase transmembrane domain-containing protein [Roseiflexaceae bacterium]|nr:lysylphosphatidylglycerol synthase transmembrane domain-containing protein [Roseiflexaceae bacterium]